MTDFLTLLAEMRQGQVASDISAKFAEMMTGVLESGGKGEMTIKLTVQPSKKGMGGRVLEVETEHDVKLKRPELKIGKAVFFVDDNGDLTRDNPAQTQMFDQGAPSDVRH